MNTYKNVEVNFYSFIIIKYDFQIHPQIYTRNARQGKLTPHTIQVFPDVRYHVVPEVSEKLATIIFKVRVKHFLVLVLLDLFGHEKSQTFLTPKIDRRL